jgi:BA14K-like protein
MTTNGKLKAIAAAALIGLGALTLPAPAEAGRGYYHGHGGSNWGAGLLGFGVGAIVGSALTPREVYVVPDDDYYEPAYGPAGYGPGYGPPPWTPEWYTYCAQRYRSFNSHTGYFRGYDGLPYFCQ